MSYQYSPYGNLLSFKHLTAWRGVLQGPHKHAATRPEHKHDELVQGMAREVKAGLNGQSRGPYAKGLASREELLHVARRLFNDHGLDTTFEDLARELGWTKGRITHHFNTKEDLILELMGRCSEELDANAREHGAIASIDHLASLYKRALDIIDTYRAVYTISILGTVTRIDLHEVHEQRMKHRLEQMRGFFQHLVGQGLLEEEVLNQRVFDPLAASTVLMFMSWPTYRNTMGRSLSYQHARSISLRSGIYVLVPHLTAKGRDEFRQVYPTL